MLATIIFIIDQVIKGFVRTRLAIGGSLVRFGPFSITRFENTGGPFSLPLSQSFLLIAHFAVLFGAIFAWKRFPTYRSALLWIIAGGASNLIDRLLFHQTTDYIGLPFGGFWNLADVSVLIGLLMLAFAKPYKN